MGFLINTEGGETQSASHRTHLVSHGLACANLTRRSEEQREQGIMSDDREEEERLAVVHGVTGTEAVQSSTNG
jgi:hypothetical protein